MNLNLTGLILFCWLTLRLPHHAASYSRPFVPAGFYIDTHTTTMVITQDDGQRRVYHRPTAATVGSVEREENSNEHVTLGSFLPLLGREFHTPRVQDHLTMHQGQNYTVADSTRSTQNSATRSIPKWDSQDEPIGPHQAEVHVKLGTRGLVKVSPHRVLAQLLLDLKQEVQRDFSQSSARMELYTAVVCLSYDLLATEGQRKAVTVAFELAGIEVRPEHLITPATAMYEWARVDGQHRFSTINNVPWTPDAVVSIGDKALRLDVVVTKVSENGAASLVHLEQGPAILEWDVAEEVTSKVVDHLLGEILPLCRQQTTSTEEAVEATLRRDPAVLSRLRQTALRIQAEFRKQTGASTLVVLEDLYTRRGAEDGGSEFDPSSQHHPPPPEAEGHEPVGMMVMEHGLEDPHNIIHVPSLIEFNVSSSEVYLYAVRHSGILTKMSEFLRAELKDFSAEGHDKASTVLIGEMAENENVEQELLMTAHRRRQDGDDVLAVGAWRLSARWQPPQEHLSAEPSALRNQEDDARARLAHVLQIRTSPFTYSIELSGEQAEVMIPFDTLLPFKATRLFTFITDDQLKSNLVLLKGERIVASGNFVVCQSTVHWQHPTAKNPVPQARKSVAEKYPKPLSPIEKKRKQEADDARKQQGLGSGRGGGLTAYLEVTVAMSKEGELTLAYQQFALPPGTAGQAIALVSHVDDQRWKNVRFRSSPATHRVVRASPKYLAEFHHVAPEDSRPGSCLGYSAQATEFLPAAETRSFQIDAAHFKSQDHEFFLRSNPVNLEATSTGLQVLRAVEEKPQVTEGDDDEARPVRQDL